jgi:hypothetical protein
VEDKYHIPPPTWSPEYKRFSEQSKSALNFPPRQERVNHNITKDLEDRAKTDPSLRSHGQNNSHRGMVRNTIDNWGASSGKGNAASLALQIAAQHHWDIPNSHVKHLNQNSLSNKWAIHKWNEAQSIYKDHHVFLHHFLDSVYQATQEHLKDTPILLLHRGHSFNHPNIIPSWATPRSELVEDDRGERNSELSPPHREIKFKTQPLISWSTDYSTAHSFANSPYGHVLTSAVPREHIWSLPHTGPGYSIELEAITIGGIGKAKQKFNHPDEWNYINGLTKNNPQKYRETMMDYA